MPIYCYACNQGHITEEFRQVSERTEPGVCGDCKSPTLPTLRGYRKKIEKTERKDGIIVKYRYGKPKHSFHFRDALCKDCNEESFVDCTDLKTGDYSKEDVSCDHCGSKNLELKPACHNIDRFSERFPYWDRGLGMWLKSKAHRREMCKKLGVVPVDGDIEIGRSLETARQEEREDKAVLNKLKDRINNHQGYAEYRRMKDRGWKPKYKHRRQ
jgi:transcription elongation factor Elf1